MEGSSIIWQNIVDRIGGTNPTANLMGSQVLNSLIGDETCRDSGGKKLRCQKEGWHGLGHGARVCTLVVYFGHLSRSSVFSRKPWSFGPDMAMATSLASSTYNGSCSLQGRRWLRRDVPPCVLFLSYLPCAYLDTEPLISLHQSHHPRGHQHWVHRLQVDYSEHGNFYY